MPTKNHSPTRIMIHIHPLNCSVALLLISSLSGYADLIRTNAAGNWTDDIWVNQTAGNTSTLYPGDPPGSTYDFDNDPLQVRHAVTLNSAVGDTGGSTFTVTGTGALDITTGGVLGDATTGPWKFAFLSQGSTTVSGGALNLDAGNVLRTTGTGTITMTSGSIVANNTIDLNDNSTFTISGGDLDAGGNFDLGRITGAGETTTLNVIGSDATFDVAGNFELESIGTSVVDLDFNASTGISTINVLGSVILGNSGDGNLEIQLNGFTSGSPIALFDTTSGSVSGTFDNISVLDGASTLTQASSLGNLGVDGDYFVEYQGGTGGDINLYLVPEPSTMAFLVAFSLLFFGSRCSARR